MEKLIKSALGQWKIFKEELLAKAPDEPTPSVPAPESATPSSPVPSVPATPAPAAEEPSLESKRLDNHKHLAKLMGSLNTHMAAGRYQHAEGEVGKIRAHVLGAKPGEVDIGKLSEMRERILRDPARPNQGKPFTGTALATMINHHLGDAKSLKDIYENHGGEKTIEALMRTNGVNGKGADTYSHMKFKNPSIFADLQDLVNPSKGAQYYRKENKHKGVLQHNAYAKTAPNPELQQKVHEAYEKSMYSDDGDHEFKPTEDAVVKRSLELFKRHHGFDKE